MREALSGGMKFIREKPGIVMITAVALLTALSIFAGGVSARVDEDALRLDASFYPALSVGYDDIRAARLAEDLDPGQRLHGVGGARIKAGRYLSPEVGGCTLYAYARVPLLIDLTTDGGHILFNASSGDATRELYDELLNNLPDIP